MKILLLFALILSLVLSPDVLAKKPQITSTWSWDSRGELDVEIDDGQSCKFACSTVFGVSFHIHRDTSLGLLLLTGDDVEPIYTRPLPDNVNMSIQRFPGCLEVPAGETFSLVWVLESTKRNRRIIDAEEVYAGTCSP